VRGARVTAIQLTDFFGLNNAMDAFTGRAPADDA
jgi:hypothetical protein